MPGEITWVPRAHLPPVGIILVYNLEQVPSIKPQACFFARDEVVSGWVVVKVALHKYLGLCDLILGTYSSKTFISCLSGELVSLATCGSWWL